MAIITVKNTMGASADVKYHSAEDKEVTQAVGAKKEIRTTKDVKNPSTMKVTLGGKTKETKCDGARILNIVGKGNQDWALEWH